MSSLKGQTMLTNNINVALAQIDVVPGDPRANAYKVVDEMLRASERGVDIIIFPELCIPGYLIGDMPEIDDFVHEVHYWTRHVIKATARTDIVVVFGTYAFGDGSRGEDGRLRKVNAGIVAQNGHVLTNRAGRSFFAKTNMPKYREFDDERQYTSALKLATEEEVPLSEYLAPYDIVIRGEMLRVGMIICEDMWDKDYFYKPARILAAQGVDLMINISCSPWGWQKNRARHAVVRDLLEDIKVPFVYVNNVGTQNNGKNIIVFDGSSTVYRADGSIVATVPPYEDMVMDVAVGPHMSALSCCTEASDTEQLHNGIVAGLEGYFKTVPSSLQRVVIGLSGGIDSAVVAAYCVHVLGRDRVHAINMPYEGRSGEETQRIARSIAKKLGISFEVIPITDVVNAKARLAGIMPDMPAFKTVQAIERMTVLAAKAAALGAIFTCNGNKTETAFGYCTLNGDARGAVAPIGDCLKGEVYQLAHHLNTSVFGRTVIPRACLDIDPMDELGGEGSTQKDPFDYGRVLADGTLVRGYHDELARAFVCFRMSPEDVHNLYKKGVLEETFKLPSGRIASLFKNEVVFIDDLERCWNLLAAAVFKRVQGPPNILVSKRAFGFDLRECIPRNTRRFALSRK